jgi:hypothetical protein
MIEIRNKLRSPIQIVVRSRVEVPGSGSRSFTTLNIPGVGAGNNVYLLEDERHTEYIDRLEKKNIISTRRVPNKNRKED